MTEIQVATMPTIDLNCDMGESFGRYRLGLDEEVIKYISSANIACGWHAGDSSVMDRTVRSAASYGVGVGAHPGYPDLMGFGRRFMDCTAEEIKGFVIYQVGALMAFCRVNGVRMRHVKPHGALYLAAIDHEAVAEAIAEAVVSVDPELMYVALAGPGGDVMTRVGERVGLRVVYEAFPDRAYTPEGKLTSRRLPGAVISDPEEVAERVVMIARERKLRAVDGSLIELDARTVCVHGDNPAAVELVRRIRQQLEADGIAIRPMGSD
jgi:5-oxoprolinase (ATP-hydrolysing) subunit A